MTTRHYILKIKKTHLYETYATCDVAVMGDLTEEEIRDMATSQLDPCERLVSITEYKGSRKIGRTPYGDYTMIRVYSRK